MIFNFDSQLQGALRALEEVVAPALAGGEKHDVEQLMGAIATIGFVKTRMPQARRHYRNDLRGWIAFAREAANIAGPFELLDSARIDAEKLLEDPEADLADFEAGSRRLADAATALSCQSVGQSFEARLDAVIFSHAEGRIGQYRQWCSLFGFEIHPEKLPEPAWHAPSQRIDA